MSSKPKVILLCGKAGSGKSYILNLIHNYYKESSIINYLTLKTDRPPRLGEEHCIDYDFCTLNEFNQYKYLIKKGYSVGEGENWQYWKYGLPVDAIKENKVNIGILDPESILTLYESQKYDLQIIYVYAHPQLRIERQFNRAESTKEYSEICRRFLNDEKDFKLLDKFNFIKIYNSYSEENEGIGMHGVALIYELIEEFADDMGNMN